MMDQRYGMHRTAGFMVTVVMGKVVLERRRNVMLERCANIPMAEAVEMARFILSMRGPIDADAQDAMDAG